MQSGGTILVVDGDASDQTFARDVLVDEGYRVLLASSGEEGTGIVEREPVDCILIDSRMRGLDGVAGARLRATAATARPRICITAPRDSETLDRAVIAAADDFVSKPFRRDELVIRVRSAMQQRERLRRVELQREQLMAYLVHDLKNPVNAITLHARSITRAAGDVERARRSAARIEDECRELMRMITNLLDISRADEGRLAPVIERVDASELVDRVVDELRTRAQAAGVRIVADIAVGTLDGDADLIARVIANLLDNAIRHAPEASTVRIGVAASDSGVELSVADSGPGIPEPLRAKVFDRFQSGNGSSGRANRGLGLTFCKLAVEAHRGRIWIEDAGPGAAFCIRLPARE